MIARCARCQGTFTTDRFGVQTCPHCGSEILLADPAGGAAAPGGPAAAPPPPPPPQGAPGEPAWGAPPPMPPPPSAAPPPWAPPPPPAAPPPPPGGWADPSRGFGAPPPYGPPPGGAGGWPPGAPPPPVPGELPAPFFERARLGFLPSFLATFKLVALQPADFFRRVQLDQVSQGGYHQRYRGGHSGAAVLFGVIAATVGSVASALYGWLSGAATLAAMQEMLSKMPPEQARLFSFLTQGATGTWAVVQVVLAPLFALAGIYLNAGLVHLFLLLFKGAPRRFDATLTVVGYATGLQLLLVLPGCGGMVASLWYLVVLIIGLGEAQRCGPGKAAAAVFAPVVLMALCCCAVLGAVGASGAGVLEQLKQAAEAANKSQGTNL